MDFFMKNSIDVGSPRHFSVALPRERIAAKCIEYLAAISRLRAAASDLLAASRGAMQAEAALRLYRQLALFVGENFAHMHVEETLHNQVLWSCYSDEELRALEGSIVASLPPSENLSASCAGWFRP